MVSFGEGDNQLHWPENKIADLLKYIFIFHYMYIVPSYMFEAEGDYEVYELIAGKYHPFNTQLRNENLLNKINEDIAKITDETIDLQIGWLFNPFQMRMDADGDIPLPSHVPRTQQSVTFITLYRWIYGHVSGKKKYLHPYE